MEERLTSHHHEMRWRIDRERPQILTKGEQLPVVTISRIYGTSTGSITLWWSGHPQGRACRKLWSKGGLNRPVNDDKVRRRKCKGHQEDHRSRIARRSWCPAPRGGLHAHLLQSFRQRRAPEPGPVPHKRPSPTRRVRKVGPRRRNERRLVLNLRPKGRSWTEY